MAGPGLLAHAMVPKYCDHLPLAALGRYALAGAKVHTDDSPVKMLKGWGHHSQGPSRASRIDGDMHRSEGDIAFEYINVVEEDRLVTITMNRPERRNTLSLATSRS